ncbi:MAG: prolyl oligopeptidase family serine peptidase [Planctomycetota bacterium]
MRPMIALCAPLLASLLQGSPPAAEGPPPQSPATQAPETVTRSSSDRAPTKPVPKAGLKTLTAADYGRWESLRSPGTLAPNGKWLAFTVTRSNGEDELHLAPSDGADEARATVPYGRSAQFSDDSHFFACLVGLSESSREKLEKQKKPVQNRFEMHELDTGTVTNIDGVASFAFSEDGKHVALKRYRPKDRKKGGADLIVRDLTTGAELCFGNVGDYAWSEAAPLLAMVTDTIDEVGGGVTLLHADTGRMRSLDSHKGRYTGLSWREHANDLAFLRITSHNSKEDEQPSHVLTAWTGLRQNAKKYVFDHRDDERFPETKRLVATSLLWHDDGAAIFFGVRPWDRRPKPKADESPAAESPATGAATGGTAAETETADAASKDDATPPKTDPKSLRDSLTDPAGVDVWHSKDARIIPEQKKQAERDRNRSQLYAFWLKDAKWIALGDDTIDSVSLLEGSATALGRDTKRHERTAMFGPELRDVYLIDTRTGERRRILEAHKFVYGSSPDGRHLLFVKNDTWHVHNIDNDTSRPLTAGVDADFINDERGVLTDENPPYGVAGWLEDSSAVLLHSRFDLWLFPMGAKTPRRLTDGRATQQQHRLLDLDPDEQWVDAERPLYVALYGERSKQAGFARVDLQQESVEQLHLADARVTGLRKSKYAETFAFTQQTLTDSPDVFVAGPFLAEPRQVSATNPQQADFEWAPKAELVDYQSQRGDTLQGALFYPAGYEPGGQYPMIVYIYEKRSQNLHSYSSPTERSPYNPSVFTSLGYFVYQPDIVYRAQNPGISALECVVPAVEAVLAKGDIDAAKIGLVGHSWGAYQTAFIVTRSNLFAAGVAGAPLTNMMSMSMSIYWNSGSTDARIFHESQGRMDKPFWQDVETYMANSPIFGMDSLETPLLIAFGDKDGAVDWHQGIEMYNAARLAQKQLVMLVYDGENHSLRKKPNQVDYHWRVREWFGHYVKGEPAPAWITDGKSHLEREEELREMKARNKTDKKKAK